MKTTTLNEAQLLLLDMMSFVKSEKTLNDLRQVICDYFAKEAQTEIDHLWNIGEMNNEKVESFRSLHQRTPYN